MDVYVYYRVSDKNASELQTRVLDMQKQLTDLAHVTTSLKLRSEQAASLQTWMEIYFSTPDDFLDLLNHTVAKLGLVNMIDGERHAEIFVDMPPCA
jgi:hypothetical protein